MQGIPQENIIAARTFLIGLESLLIFGASVLWLYCAKKFYLSPDKPPHPLRYRPTPPHFTLAFILTLLTVIVRSLVTGSLSVNSPYEVSIFGAMFLSFTALSGARKVGEAPVTGTLVSIASALLCLASLFFYDPITKNLAVDHINIYTLYRLLLVLGYSLMFTSLSLRLSAKWRPPLTEPVRSRGLVTSPDLLTDHRHKSMALYRTSVPILLFSLSLQCYYNVLSKGVLFEYSANTLFTLLLIWAPLVHLHLLSSNDNPILLFEKNRTSTFLSRTLCSMKGGAIATALSALPLILLVFVPHMLGSTVYASYGTIGMVGILSLSFVPCIFKRGAQRAFSKHEYLSFDMLLNSDSDVPITTVEVNNPHLKRVDMDNALVILGFRDYPVSDLDPHNDTFRAACFGHHMTGLGYFNHIVFLLVLLQLPVMAMSRTPMYTLFCGSLAVVSILMAIRVFFPWFIVAYKVEPRKETCLMVMKIYSGSLLASPSKLVKQLTSHLIIEHESML